MESLGYLVATIVAVVAALGGVAAERLRKSSDELLKGAELGERIRADLETDYGQRIEGLEFAVAEATARAMKAEAQVADLLSKIQTLQSDYEHLSSISGPTQVGMAIIDQELRYLYINMVGARMNGVPVTGHLGKTPTEMLPELGERIGPLLRSVLERQEEVTGVLTDGGGRNWSYRYIPVMTSDGAGIGVQAYFKLLDDTISIG